MICLRILLLGFRHSEWPEQISLHFRLFRCKEILVTTSMRALSFVAVDLEFEILSMVVCSSYAVVLVGWLN
jgi:hypothetical protein